MAIKVKGNDFSIKYQIIKKPNLPLLTEKKAEVTCTSAYFSILKSITWRRCCLIVIIEVPTASRERNLWLRVQLRLQQYWQEDFVSRLQRGCGALKF